MNTCINFLFFFFYQNMKKWIFTTDILTKLMFYSFLQGKITPQKGIEAKWPASYLLSVMEIWFISLSLLSSNAYLTGLKRLKIVQQPFIIHWIPLKKDDIPRHYYIHPSIHILLMTFTAWKTTNKNVYKYDKYTRSEIHIFKWSTDELDMFLFGLIMNTLS